MRFFRPDALRIFLFAVFLIVAYFGSQESDAFSEEREPPATAFWTFWVLLLAPIELLLLLLRKAGLRIDLFAAPAAVFWAVQIIYYYAMACLIAALIQAVSRKIAPAARH